MKCKYCELTMEECICAAVDRMFAEHDALMKDLAELEEAEKASRCLACYFSPCRCSDGLKGKKH